MLLCVCVLCAGHWSWHERWLYRDQIYDLPDRPRAYVQAQQQYQQQKQQLALAHTQQHNLQPRPPSASTQNFTLNLQTIMQQQADESSPLSANPQSLANDRFPDLPRRYRDGTFKRSTSEYCYTYRDPVSYSTELGVGSLAPGASGSPTSPSSTHTGPTPGSRIALRERGRKNAPAGFRHHHASPFYHETDEQKAQVRTEQHSFRLWGRINNAHCALPYQTETQRAYAFDKQHVDKMDRAYFMKIEGKEYKEAMVKAKLTNLIRGAGGDHPSAKK